jgi:hypothetical protein
MVTTQRVDRVAAEQEAQRRVVGPEHPDDGRCTFAGSFGSLPTISLTICRSPPEDVS